MTYKSNVVAEEKGKQQKTWKQDYNAEHDGKN